MSNALLVPIVMWDAPPAHQITCICSISEGAVTGSNTGELVAWSWQRCFKPQAKDSLSSNNPEESSADDFSLAPSMLMVRNGSSPINCVVRAFDRGTEYVFSASSEGFVTKWTALGGHCLISRHAVPFIARCMSVYHPPTYAQGTSSGSAVSAGGVAPSSSLLGGSYAAGPTFPFLTISGDSSEIYILNSRDLKVLCVLSHDCPVVHHCLSPSCHNKSETSPHPLLSIPTGFQVSSSRSSGSVSAERSDGLSTCGVPMFRERYILSFCEDGVVYVWDMDLEGEITFNPQFSPMYSAKATALGAGRDVGPSILRLQPLVKLRLKLPRNAFPVSLAVSLDGVRLFVLYSNSWTVLLLKEFVVEIDCSVPVSIDGGAGALGRNETGEIEDAGVPLQLQVLDRGSSPWAGVSFIANSKRVCLFTSQGSVYICTLPPPSAPGAGSNSAAPDSAARLAPNALSVLARLALCPPTRPMETTRRGAEALVACSPVNGDSSSKGALVPGSLPPYPFALAPGTSTSAAAGRDACPLGARIAVLACGEHILAGQTNGSLYYWSLSASLAKERRDSAQQTVTIEREQSAQATIPYVLPAFKSSILDAFDPCVGPVPFPDVSKIGAASASSDADSKPRRGLAKRVSQLAEIPLQAQPSGSEGPTAALVRARSLVVAPAAFTSPGETNGADNRLSCLSATSPSAALEPCLQVASLTDYASCGTILCKSYASGRLVFHDITVNSPPVVTYHPYFTGASSLKPYVVDMIPINSIESVSGHSLLILLYSDNSLVIFSIIPTLGGANAAAMTSSATASGIPTFAPSVVVAAIFPAFSSRIESVHWSSPFASGHLLALPPSAQDAHLQAFCSGLYWRVQQELQSEARSLGILNAPPDAKGKQGSGPSERALFGFFPQAAVSARVASSQNYTPPPPFPVYSMCAGDAFSLACEDGSLHVGSIRDRALVVVLRGHDSCVVSVHRDAWCIANGYICTQTASRNVYIWSQASSSIVRIIPAEFAVPPRSLSNKPATGVVAAVDNSLTADEFEVLHMFFLSLSSTQQTLKQHRSQLDKQLQSMRIIAARAQTSVSNALAPLPSPLPLQQTSSSATAGSLASSAAVGQSSPSISNSALGVPGSSAAHDISVDGSVDDATSVAKAGMQDNANVLQQGVTRPGASSANSMSAVATRAARPGVALPPLYPNKISSVQSGQALTQSPSGPPPPTPGQAASLAVSTVSGNSVISGGGKPPAIPRPITPVIGMDATSTSTIAAATAPHSSLLQRETLARSNVGVIDTMQQSVNPAYWPLLMQQLYVLFHSGDSGSVQSVMDNLHPDTPEQYLRIYQQGASGQKELAPADKKETSESADTSKLLNASKMKRGGSFSKSLVSLDIDPLAANTPVLASLDSELIPSLGLALSGFQASDLSGGSSRTSGATASAAQPSLAVPTIIRDILRRPPMRTCLFHNAIHRRHIAVHAVDAVSLYEDLRDYTAAAPWLLSAWQPGKLSASSGQAAFYSKAPYVLRALFGILSLMLEWGASSEAPTRPARPSPVDGTRATSGVGFDDLVRAYSLLPLLPATYSSSSSQALATRAASLTSVLSSSSFLASQMTRTSSGGGLVSISKQPRAGAGVAIGDALNPLQDPTVVPVLSGSDYMVPGTRPFLLSFGAFSDSSQGLSVLFPRVSAAFGRWTIDPTFAATHAMALNTILISLQTYSHPGASHHFKPIVSTYNSLLPTSVPHFIEPDFASIATFLISERREVYCVAKTLVQALVHRSSAAKRVALTAQWSYLYNLASIAPNQSTSSSSSAGQLLAAPASIAQGSQTASRAGARPAEVAPVTRAALMAVASHTAISGDDAGPEPQLDRRFRRESFTDVDAMAAIAASVGMSSSSVSIASVGVGNDPARESNSSYSLGPPSPNASLAVNVLSRAPSLSAAAREYDRELQTAASKLTTGPVPPSLLLRQHVSNEELVAAFVLATLEIFSASEKGRLESNDPADVRDDGSGLDPSAEGAQTGDDSANLPSRPPTARSPSLDRLQATASGTRSLNVGSSDPLATEMRKQYITHTLLRVILYATAYLDPNTTTLAAATTAIVNAHVGTSISASVRARLVLAADCLNNGFSIWRPYIADLLDLIRKLHYLSNLPHYSALSASIMRALMQAGRVSPRHFVNCMGKEAIHSKNTDKQRANALMSVVNLVKQYPTALQMVLPTAVQIIIRCLDPAEPSLRRALFVSATAALHTLVQRYPMATFHKDSQRLAIGASGNASLTNASLNALGAAPTQASSAGEKSESLIIVYDVRTATKWKSLGGHKGSITACSFSPSGNTLVSYSADEHPPTVRFYNTALSGLFSSLIGMQGRCTSHHTLPPAKVSAAAMGGVESATFRQMLLDARFTWISDNKGEVVQLVREDGTTFKFAAP